MENGWHLRTGIENIIPSSIPCVFYQTSVPKWILKGNLNSPSMYFIDWAYIVWALYLKIWDLWIWPITGSEPAAEDPLRTSWMWPEQCTELYTWMFLPVLGLLAHSLQLAPMNLLPPAFGWLQITALQKQLAVWQWCDGIIMSPPISGMPSHHKVSSALGAGQPSNATASWESVVQEHLDRVGNGH